MEARSTMVHGDLKEEVNVGFGVSELGTALFRVIHGSFFLEIPFRCFHVLMAIRRKSNEPKRSLRKHLLDFSSWSIVLSFDSGQTVEICDSLRGYKLEYEDDQVSSATVLISKDRIGSLVSLLFESIESSFGDLESNGTFLSSHLCDDDWMETFHARCKFLPSPNKRKLESDTLDITQ